MTATVPGTGIPQQAGPVLRPSRVQNWLEGGSDYSTAERDIARQLAASHPVLSVLYQHNRAFTSRAAAWAARRGIRRYLDLGCGVPVVLRDETRLPMLHEVARTAGARDPQVVYLDNDPVATWRVAGAARGEPGVTVLLGDLADPGKVLAGPSVRDLLGAGQPVCVLMTSVLHYWDAGTARRITAAYTAALPAGSVLLISVAYLDEETAEDRRRLIPGLPFWNHDSSDAESFFAGLLLARGGVAGVERWPLVGDTGGRRGVMIGGAGIKPAS